MMTSASWIALLSSSCSSPVASLTKGSPRKVTLGWASRRCVMRSVRRELRDRLKMVTVVSVGYEERKRETCAEICAPAPIATRDFGELLEEGSMSCVAKSEPIMGRDYFHRYRIYLVCLTY